MARTPTSDEATSLDLFLDTICNMFGGIVFIAMLVALLAFANARLVPGAHGISPEVVEQARAEQREREALKGRIEELGAALAELEKNRSVLASDNPDLQRLSERTTAVQKLLDEAQQRLEDLAALRGQLQARVRAVGHRVDTAAGRVTELQAEIARLEAAIASEASRRTVEARLPVQRRTTKIPAHLVLRNGKVHVLYVYRGGDLAGLDQVDDRDVEMTQLGEVSRFRCRPNGGFPVTDRLLEHPRWRELTAAISPKRFFLYIIVFTDSFAEFMTVKAAALESGFQYDVIPLLPDQQVDLVPGTDFSVQ